MPVFQERKVTSGRLINLSKVIQVLRSCDIFIIHQVDHKANSHIGGRPQTLQRDGCGGRGLR